MIGRGYMVARAAAGDHAPMPESSIHTAGRSRSDAAAVAREARRLIGLERQYHCRSCGGERRSWSRLAACPDCGEDFAAAVIRRAALAS
jgi:hypothetical protein